MEEFSCITESISFTTRAQRTGEIPGRDYYFVSKEEFEKRIREGDFLEHAEVFGYHYGTSRELVKEKQAKGNHVLLVIDTQGAMQLKSAIDAVFIFLRPPSIEELRARLIKRSTESHEVIEKRIAWATHELQVAEKYDYQVINDDLLIAYETLKSIIIAEEHKTCHFRQFSTKRG